MRHLREDRCGEADVVPGRDGEEDVEPVFRRAEAGVEGVEAWGVWAVGEEGEAREGDFVDAQGGVVEVEEERYCWGALVCCRKTEREQKRRTVLLQFWRYGAFEVLQLCFERF